VPDRVLADVEELSAVPAPWDDRVAAGALRHLMSGDLGAAAGRRLALAMAHRAPVGFHRDLADLAERERHVSPGRGLAAAAHVLATRLEIHRAFDPTPEETP
jgi:hypothetical protein